MRKKALILSCCMIGICAFLFFKQQEIVSWAAGRIICARLGPAFTYSSLAVSRDKTVLRTCAFASFFSAEEVVVRPGALWLLFPPSSGLDVRCARAKLFGLDLVSGRARAVQRPGNAQALQIEGNAAYGTGGTPFSLAGLVTSGGKAGFFADSVEISIAGSHGSINACTLSETGFSAMLHLTVAADGFRKACGLANAFQGDIVLLGAMTGSRNGLAGSVAFSSPRLDTDSLQLTSISGNALFSPHDLRIAPVALGLYGGRAQGSMVFTFSRERKTYDIRLAVKGMDLNRARPSPGLVSFSGRYAGKIEISGEAKTWAQALEKIRLF